MSGLANDQTLFIIGVLVLILGVGLSISWWRLYWRNTK